MEHFIWMSIGVVAWKSGEAVANWVRKRFEIGPGGDWIRRKS